MTSVSAINQKLEVYSMEKVHNSKICKKELDEILQMQQNKETISGLNFTQQVYDLAVEKLFKKKEDLER